MLFFVFITSVLSLTQLETFNTLVYPALSGNGSIGTFPCMPLYCSPIPCVSCNEYNELLEIRMYDVELAGSVPTTIALLSSLEGVYLWNNHLKGTIPSEIGMMNKTSTLLVSSNRISGTIPTTIASMASLRLFNAYDNQLSGHLPSVWPSQMIHIVLYMNRLVGNVTIPSTLDRLTSCYLRERQSDYDYNCFTCPIDMSVHVRCRGGYINQRVCTENGSDCTPIPPPTPLTDAPTPLPTDERPTRQPTPTAPTGSRPTTDSSAAATSPTPSPTSAASTTSSTTTVALAIVGSVLFILLIVSIVLILFLHRRRRSRPPAAASAASSLAASRSLRRSTHRSASRRSRPSSLHSSSNY